jgi:hypothetical protein
VDAPSDRVVAPALVIRLEVEGAPSVVVDARNKGERRRVFDWINSKPELLEFVHAADALSTVDDFGYPDASEHRIPGGAYKNMSLAEVAALGAEGERWFVSMLARLEADDWMRPVVEEFVREQLPHMWERYRAWLKTRTAAAT